MDLLRPPRHHGHGHAPEPKPIFTLFPQLPPEIRHMIWVFAAYAQPRRLFQVEPLLRTTTTSSACLRSYKTNNAHPPQHPPCTAAQPCKPLPPPALPQVSREARYCTARLCGSWFPLRAPGFAPGLEGRWTWFNPRRDVLIVHAWDYASGFGAVVVPSPNPGPLAGQQLELHLDNNRQGRRRLFDLSSFSAHITSIAIGLRSLVHADAGPQGGALHDIHQLVAKDLPDRAVCPRLREFLFFDHVLDVCVPADAPVPQDLWPQGEDAVLLDAKDRGALAKMLAFYERYALGPVDAGTLAVLRDLAGLATGADTQTQIQNRQPYGGVGPGMRGVARGDDTDSAYARYAGPRYTDLRNIWVKAHWLDIPVDAPHKISMDLVQMPPAPAVHTPQYIQFDARHPWVYDVLAGMPAFRLVVLFRLCRGRHPRPAPGAGGVGASGAGGGGSSVGGIGGMGTGDEGKGKGKGKKFVVIKDEDGNAKSKDKSKGKLGARSKDVRRPSGGFGRGGFRGD
ncbi:hypothetical protein F5B20DRAFT_416714 [Whalleya microplaca]|nr:hypothetical protein F5B20DRAFT_416714 [Whalleya microplaca]